MDATTQPGYAGTPLIQLDGTLASGATAGLTLRANDSTIRGFAIDNFPDEGLEIDGLTGLGDHNTLADNDIGLLGGNADNGILLTEGADGNTVRENTIRSSGHNGIQLTRGSSGNLILRNTITLSGQTVARAAGLNVSGATSTGNTLSQNSVYLNDGIGIDLSDSVADGVDANDAGDGDSGGNQRQNGAVLVTAELFPGRLDYDVDTTSLTAGSYTIEFYASTDLEAGLVEGRQFLGAVAGVSAGHPSLTGSLAPGSLAVGDYLTITTTNESTGDTSEFSAAATVAAGNTPPTVSSISNQTIAEDGSTGAVSFTVGDAETSAGSLVITATSSQASLIPDSNITLGGSGSSRTIAVQPLADQSGVSTITVTVDDGATTTQTSFNVTVTAENDAATGRPVIAGSPVEDQLLTAIPGDVSDPDGVGTPAYQWLRGSVPISGATDPFLLLTDADVGQQISLQVTFVDLSGFDEGPLTSLLTPAIVNVNDAPVATPDFYTLSEDVPLATGESGGVLGNDLDVDGDDLTATLVTGPASGLLIPSSTESAMAMARWMPASRCRFFPSMTFRYRFRSALKRISRRPWSLPRQMVCWQACEMQTETR